ncbi:MAG: T9SS type A sorting domain-containing protein [Bacteroidetes bacterium]|nr:T9SS type A sorting domain-containing protein [Bacteroidota bacterium]
MKKIYLSLITALAAFSANAQLTNANHSPVSGDVSSTWQCDSLAISPGASGANATWNFGTIATHTSVVKNYTTTANTNTAYPSTGVAVGSSPTNISYYTSNATDLKYWGGNITVGTNNATLVYTTAAEVAAYPMSLNTTSSAATAGNITLLTFNGTFTGNSTTLADGTGTLILPSGTYVNAMRVVTTQTINFAIPTALTNGTVTQKNWDYYNVGSTKEAWFSITTSTIVITGPAASSSTQTLVTRRNPSVVTGLNPTGFAPINVGVFPNPSSTTVNFITESTEAKQVAVYDVTGKLVAKQNLTDGKLTLDVSSYTTGLYMYSVIGNANETLKSGKITVSH